jgi:hypothetical protein
MYPVEDLTFKELPFQDLVLPELARSRGINRERVIPTRLGRQDLAALSILLVP